MTTHDESHTTDRSRGDDLPRIGQPAQRALANAGYTNLDQLTQVRAADILKLHGMGPKAIRILRQALAERGQAFADETAAQP